MLYFVPLVLFPQKIAPQRSHERQRHCESHIYSEHCLCIRLEMHDYYSIEVADLSDVVGVPRLRRKLPRILPHLLSRKRRSSYTEHNTIM
jgi:hypothetical protein